MKRNVDLTENFDFQKRNERMLLFPYQRVSTLHKLLLKDELKEEPPKDRWGIYQGNMVERLGKKLTRDYYLGKTCERCGKRLFPYYELPLCKKCDIEISASTFEGML